MNPTPLVVFSTRSYSEMGKDVCRLGSFEAGEIETKTFPDGERYQRLLTSVIGRDVVLLGGTIADEDTLEIFDLACALVKHGAHTLSLFIPYFGYSTMERATRAGEVITAKARARLLSSIPAAASGNRVVLLDLHSEGIPQYFEGALRPVHLYAKPIVLAAAHRLGGREFVLGCTDAGRAKWVESLANDLGVPAAFVFKRRRDAESTEVTAVSAQVAGKPVVVYDDMIRTGGSLLSAARAYLDAGAREISAVATHGLFP
ncbi:MAG: ribose-phosphate pyrophosphokinase, partial [Planctomycetes bacterium]|nr:ribose-phosphate pyrophosphokinase [Planctomycetota bacterium]